VVSTGNLGCPHGGHSSMPERITMYALMRPAKNMASVTIKISIPITPLDTGGLARFGRLVKETSEAANKTDWLEWFVTSAALHKICLQCSLSTDLHLSS